MAIFKKPPEPEPEPVPPNWPHSIKCHVCSASKAKHEPGVRWAQRHCKQGCAWYACPCGGRMWIAWSKELEAWVTKRTTRFPGP